MKSNYFFNKHTLKSLLKILNKMLKSLVLHEKTKIRKKKIPPYNLIFQLTNYFPTNLANIHYCLSHLYVLLCIKVNNSFRAGQLYIQINSASSNLQTIVQLQRLSVVLYRQLQRNGNNAKIIRQLLLCLKSRWKQKPFLVLGGNLIKVTGLLLHICTQKKNLSSSTPIIE